MTLRIENPEADRLAREIADQAGVTIEEAVVASLREKLAAQERSHGNLDRFVADVMEIGRRCAALPVIDPRSADEIIGYDEHGAPA